jgi:proline iminopeptidase
MHRYHRFAAAIRFVTLVLFGALLISCHNGAEPPRLLSVGDGRLAVHGGTIWYKITGAGVQTPVVLLHGGPGLSSFYLKPFEGLGSDRQVIRYDQLGGGKSEKTTDSTMFNIDHFVSELDSLRTVLGVQRWHVLGHSWGTILAVEYYRVHPKHVASLTLCSPVLDIPAWASNARQLVTTLSDSSQRAIRLAEATQRYEDPSFQNALGEFYGTYVWRHPNQADLDSMMATFNATLYNYMQGPSEFTITGTLKDYDATPFLSQIEVPTLYTVGEFDEANPKIVERFASLTPGAKFDVLQGAAHMTPWDAPDENVRVVGQFLRAVDSVAATQK